MKGLTQARNDLSEYINDINDAISLIKSSDPNTQLEGLEQLHAELTHLKESEAWQLLEKSKLKQLVYINKQLDALLELIHLAIEEFEQNRGREKNLTLISQKAGRLVLKLPKTGQRNFYSKMIIRLLLLVAPAGGIYLITDYITDRNRLKKDRFELISPIKSYEYKSMENSYLIEADTKEAYYERLNQLYFDEKTDDSEKTKQLGDDKVLLKVMMKNSSGHVPLMLSSLQLEVSYQAQEFDWSPLSTHAELKLDLRRSILKMTHVSEAPAVNVSLTTSGGLDTSFSLVKSMKLCKAFGRKTFWELESNGDLKSGRKLYYWLGNESAYPSSEGYVINEYGRFKIIDNVEDFDSLVQGTQMSDMTMRLRYEDLRGEVTETEETMELDASYFVHDPDTMLLKEPMFTGIRKEYPNSIIKPEARIGLAGNALKLMGQEPILDPNGVQLHRDSLKMNLANLQDEEHKTVFKNVDQVLNPDGYVILYITLFNPANGEYQLQVKSNGLEVDELNIQSLVAPENTFSYPSSLDFFRPKQTEAGE